MELIAVVKLNNSFWVGLGLPGASRGSRKVNRGPTRAAASAVAEAKPQVL